MLQDFADDINLIDKTDNFHLVAALGTGQRINLPDLLYVLPNTEAILVGNSGRVITAGFLFLPTPRPRFEHQP
jgi:hypothetical protein